jgi:hypothetical protein
MVEPPRVNEDPDFSEFFRSLVITRAFGSFGHKVVCREIRWKTWSFDFNAGVT